MIDIMYQASTDDAVTGGTLRVATVRDLHHAQRIVTAVAAPSGASIDVTAVVLPDGRDLVAEHETLWSDVL